MEIPRDSGDEITQSGRRSVEEEIAKTRKVHENLFGTAGLGVKARHRKSRILPRWKSAVNSLELFADDKDGETILRVFNMGIVPIDWNKPPQLAL